MNDHLVPFSDAYLDNVEQEICLDSTHGFLVASSIVQKKKSKITGQEEVFFNMTVMLDGYSEDVKELEFEIPESEEQPERVYGSKNCSFPSGFTCMVNPVITKAGKISFLMVNNQGSEITITNFRKSSDEKICNLRSWRGCAGKDCIFGSNGELFRVANNKLMRFELECGPLAVTELDSGFIINYVDENTGLMLQYDGHLGGQVI